MEEKKTLKIKKPRLIIFALAIAFAIMGFIDLKVNAAESLVEDIPYNEQYCKVSYFTYDYVNKSYRLRDWDLHTPHTRIALYYGDFTDNAHDPDNINNVIQNIGKGYRLCVLRDPNNSMQYWETGSYSEVHYDKNMNVKSSDSHEYGYGNTLSHAESIPTSNPDWKCIGSFKGQEKVENLTIDTNIPIFTDWDSLREYLETGFYDPSGVVIDYSQLQTDDTIGTIEKPLMNIIVNEVMENDLLGNATQKIYEVYNYVVWKNTENLDLQVEIAPFVNVNKGLFDKTFWKQIKGEWENFEILPNGTTTMTQRSDMYYLEETNSKYTEFLDNVENEYGGLNKECELFFAYRFRYIDISTMRAGKWVYVVPSSNGYTSFTEYLDGTKSSYEKIDGVSVETENVEDVNNIKDNIDLENEFLEKYETTEIDVEDATNWLQSVASFIKGTPSFVGSVMSFLPEPIRYGMYVCLFLGVIASGYAIVKALI